jgi:hypothetical protein
VSEGDSQEAAFDYSTGIMIAGLRARLTEAAEHQNPPAKAKPSTRGHPGS